jgi:hypothetical protein
MNFARLEAGEDDPPSPWKWDPFAADPSDGMVRSQSMPIQQALAPVPTTKKAKWTNEEDFLLSESVKEHGLTNWSRVAEMLPGRNGKQCRERWMNQLCPSLNRDNWTHQEDLILIQRQRVCGNLWSQVANYLPGRSANAIKNRWSWLSRHRISHAFPAPPPAAPAVPRAGFPSPPPMPPAAPVLPPVCFTQAPDPQPMARRPITFVDAGELAPPLPAEREFDLFSFRNEDGGGPPPHAHTFDNSALGRFDEWDTLDL